MTTERETDLKRHSISAILKNQSANGAIVASPDFEQYHFCWLRDSSFISYSLDLAGEHEASERYHAWANQAIGSIADKIEGSLESHRVGHALDPLHMPPARFTLEGKVVIDDWPNFQIDGYGTWLWSLGQHLDLSRQKELPSLYRHTVAMVAKYLEEFAFVPCFDVWEESGDSVHTSTLACVYGGLNAAARMLENEDYARVAQSVRETLLESAAQHGYFAKSSTNAGVDASSLWLATPFKVVDATHELFQETVRRIEDQLTLNGGIRRYAADVYYGSGAWPVLTASLGWIRVEQSDLEAAQRYRSWIEDRFSPEMLLGEQYDGNQRDAKSFDEWVDRWGPPAKELIWSHAMYVVLSAALEKSQSSQGSSSLDAGGK